MRGHDRINACLPDELILEIFLYLDSKSTRDACSLVCKRWLTLERLSRTTIRIGASGSPDLFVRLLSRRFANAKSVHVDERLSIPLPVQIGRRRRGYQSTLSSLRLHYMTEKNGSEDESYNLSDVGLTALGEGFIKLEKLSLIWCSNVTSMGLKSIAENCRSLKSLDLQQFNGHYFGSFAETTYAAPKTWIFWNQTYVCLPQVAVKRYSEQHLGWSCPFILSGNLCLWLLPRKYGSSVQQGCYVGDQGLAAIGGCCKKLEDLNLRFCEGLTDRGVVELALGCGNSLKVLGIAACAKITDVSLEAVGSHCKYLESLSLDSEFIHDKGVLAVAQGCPLLKVLKLQCINVTDEALQAVGTCCLSLELLALNSFQRFTDMSLRAIGKGCKKLKNLTLSDCFFLSDKGLEAIAAGCSELTHLEVNGCHNVGTMGLESIGRSCQHLTELALLYCQRIGNYALLEVGRGCKFLQALHLVDCSSIGDEAICCIARGCRNLKKLHIRRCYEIGNKGIIAVGENCRFLTDLSLRFCDRVGDAALIAIGQGCSLHHLNVSGCHQISDAGVIAIARGCPELSCLDVSVLQNLGDMAMAELGEGCPLLKEIVLSHCHQITDVGLSHLVRNCTMLESCHMVYCPGITAVGIATVVSSAINIKKVLVEKWKVSERTKRRAGSVITYLCVDL